MQYDVAMRHQQALDPSALTTITATLHAIEAAITDCRNAGKDSERDPAIILLARHLGTVCAMAGDDRQLRQTCLGEIAEIRRHPVLRTLSHRGVCGDEAAKRVFHAEGRAAMRRLAEALQLADGSYDIRSNKAGSAVSGEITLHGDELWVRLSLDVWEPDREVAFRQVRGRDDDCGDRNRWASINELLAPDRFAERLRDELRLSLPPRAPARLFA